MLKHEPRHTHRGSKRSSGVDHRVSQPRATVLIAAADAGVRSIGGGKAEFQSEGAITARKLSSFQCGGFELLAS